MTSAEYEQLVLQAQLSRAQGLAQTHAQNLFVQSLGRLSGTATIPNPSPPETPSKIEGAAITQLLLLIEDDL